MNSPQTHAHHVWNVYMKTLIYALVITLPPSNAISPSDYTLHTFSDYVGQPKVTFSSKGDGKFSGTLSSSSGTTSVQELEVKKNVKVTGDILARNIESSNLIKAVSIELGSKLHAESATFDRLVSVDELNVGSKLKTTGVLNVTSDASIHGKLYVSAIASRGVIEAARVITSGEIKGNMFESKGIIKTKDIDVAGTMQVKGTINAHLARFNGDVTTTKSIVMNYGEAKNMRVKDSIEIKGTLNCTSSALFSKDMTIEGSAKINGLVEMRKSTVNQLSVTNSLEAMVISMRGTQSEKSRLEVINGVITADDIVVENAIKAKTISTNNLQITDSLTSQSMSISTRIDTQSIDVSGIATINNLVVKSIEFEKGIHVGQILTENVEVTESLTTPKLTVSGTIVTDNISSKSNISITGTVIAKAVEVQNEIITKNLEAHYMNVTDTITTQQIIVVSSLETEGSFHATEIEVKKFLSVEGPISAKSNVTIEGSILANNAIIDGEMWVGDGIFIEGDGVINGRVIATSSGEFKGGLKSSSVIIDEYFVTSSGTIENELHVRGETRLGPDEQYYMVANASSVSVLVNMNVTAYATFAKSIDVQGDMLATNLNVSNNFIANEVLASERVIVHGGDIVLENGTVECVNITVNERLFAKGSISSLGNISADRLVSNIVDAHEHIIAPRITTQTMKANELQTDSIQVHDDLKIQGNIIVNGNTILGGDTVLINATSTKTNDIEVNGGVKARSVFASRLYVEDIAASGFVTADSIISKGNAKFHGRVEMKDVSSTILTSGDVNVANAVTCTTVKVGGVVEAVRVEAQKVVVNNGGELVVNGIDMGARLAELESLRARITVLESLVAKLHKIE